MINGSIVKVGPLSIRSLWSLWSLHADIYAMLTQWGITSGQAHSLAYEPNTNHNRLII